VLLAAVVLVVVLAATLFVANRLLFGGPSGPPGAPVEVRIPQGASVEHIGDILDRAGVVGNGRRWALNVRLHGDGSGLRAGTYTTLRRNERYSVILTTLRAGPAVAPTVRLTIPEGHSLRDIATVDAPRAGIAPNAYRAAVRRARPPAGYRATGREHLVMEGFLFPATYTLTKPVSATRLVQQQLQAFERTAARVDFRAAAKKNLTRYDVLIIASMIEREAAYPADRAKISAVIYNRLHAGMPLGIDATIQYSVGSWRVLTARDLRITGGYNTRTHRGLPPTPICNPGLASLKAAAHPANVKYLYYVAIPGDPKRRHHFSKTFADFQHFQATHPA
jgi:peptidoglycan lytic transglycosylase G